MHIKPILATLGLATLLAACSTIDSLTHETPEPADVSKRVTFALTAPDAMSQTRAAGDPADRSSARGGISNVDWTQYSLRYRFAVYKQGTTAADWTIDGEAQEAVAAGAYSDKEFSASLAKGSVYRVVCWADFIDATATATAGHYADKHYSTTDLRNITALDDAINDESRDAYFIAQTIDCTQALPTDVTTLTLRRPFAKLRLVASNWRAGKAEKVKITYPANVTRFKGLDALTGEHKQTETTARELTADIPQDLTNTAGNGKYYRLSYDATEKNRTLIVDYLLAKNDREADGSLKSQMQQTSIHFTFQPLDANGTATGQSVDVDENVTLTPPTGSTATTINTQVPICRNYLTTILGNFFEPEQKFKVTVNEGFYGEWVDGEPWWKPTELSPAAPVARQYIATDAAVKNNLATTGQWYYPIETIDNFAWLVDNYDTQTAIAQDADHHGRIDIELLADLDFNNVTVWKPVSLVGSNTSAEIIARGGPATFFGNGHTIRNFNTPQTTTVRIPKSTTNTSTVEFAVAGVFGAVCNFNFRDLSFDNITLNGLHAGTNSTTMVTEMYGPIAMLYSYKRGSTEDWKHIVSNVNVNNLFVYAAFDGLKKGTIKKNWVNIGMGGIIGRDITWTDADGESSLLLSNCSVANTRFFLPKWADPIKVRGNTNQLEADNFVAFCGGFIGMRRIDKNCFKSCRLGRNFNVHVNTTTRNFTNNDNPSALERLTHTADDYIKCGMLICMPTFGWLNGGTEFSGSSNTLGFSLKNTTDGEVSNSPGYVGCTRDELKANFRVWDSEHNEISQFFWDYLPIETDDTTSPGGFIHY